MSSPQDDPKLLKSLGNQVEPAESTDEGLPRLFERHFLLKRIAKGGMGELFLATSAGAIDGAERPCVLKMIRREHAEDGSFLARFLDEARIQAQLEHPGVVRVLHASHDEGGKPYVVLEHVEGRNLSEVRLRTQQLGVQVSWPDAVAVAIGLTDALTHIHERTDAEGRPLAIVHRDLSPQNVMVSYAGDVKVIDFGTARGQNRRCHTVSGIVYAKPGYVAPEVANNQAGGVPADLYAVGIMLWELLAGRRFIAGDVAEHLAAVAAGTKVVSPIAAIVDAPPELDAICQRLTATKIDDRFESASEACDDLAQLLKRAPSTSDGQRSVRVRISQLMQRLYPAEPTRTRAEFQRLVAGARRIQPPASAIVPSPSPSPAEQEQPDQKLLDGTRYSLGERIGEGASSVVYEALHVDLRRKVALKLYQPSAGSEALEAFRGEAHRVASLNHDNIVKVHDFGLTTSGQAYLSMERLLGESIDRRIAMQGSLEWRSALLLCVQICRALEAAHAADVVHGDLKPANLFLTHQGTIKLLDFGVSALAQHHQVPQSERESFHLIGTPEYLAPEQIRGASASVRTDLYSMGVVLFEMLTASLPHEADSLASLLGQKLDGRVEAPSRRTPSSRLPQSVDRLTLRLLATNPLQRFATAAELRLHIERILDGNAEGRQRSGRVVRRVASAVTLSLGLASVLGFAPGVRKHALGVAESLGQQAAAFAKAPHVPDMGRGIQAVQGYAGRAIVAARQAVESKSRVALTSTPPTTAADDIQREASGAVATASAVLPVADTGSSPRDARTSSDESARMQRALKENKPLLALQIARSAGASARRDPELFRCWIVAATATRAWGEARKAAKELANLEESPENLLSLVELERATGHADDARRTLEQVLDMDPENVKAQALKARLFPQSRVATR